MEPVDLDEAQRIDAGIWWIGVYHPASSLQANSFLLGDDRGAAIIDPGSMADFPVMMRKALDVVDISAISTIVANHQDPDVVGCLPVLGEVLTHAGRRVVAHLNTVRLLRSAVLDVPLVDAEQLGRKLALPGGQLLQFIDLSFLHSPGVIATFEPETRTLFSGDLFGAVGDAWSLYNGDLRLLAPWHEAYMPSQAILSRGLDIVERLNPARICPQHGSILQGTEIADAIRLLRGLRVGVDRLGDM